MPERLASPLSVSADDFRRAADLVDAHSVGNALKVQAILAKKDELAGVTLALVMAVRTGLNPLLGAGQQLRAAADQVEFLAWKRAGGGDGAG